MHGGVTRAHRDKDDDSLVVVLSDARARASRQAGAPPWMPFSLDGKRSSEDAMLHIAVVDTVPRRPCSGRPHRGPFLSEAIADRPQRVLDRGTSDFLQVCFFPFLTRHTLHQQHTTLLVPPACAPRCR